MDLNALRWQQTPLTVDNVGYHAGLTSYAITDNAPAVQVRYSIRPEDTAFRHALKGTGMMTHLAAVSLSMHAWPTPRVAEVARRRSFTN